MGCKMDSCRNIWRYLKQFRLRYVQLSSKLFSGNLKEFYFKTLNETTIYIYIYIYITNFLFGIEILNFGSSPLGNFSCTYKAIYTVVYHTPDDRAMNHARPAAARVARCL